MGAIWLVQTVAFEVVFGRLIVGLSWERIASDYNVLRGGFVAVALVLLVFSPMIAARLRETRT